MLKRITNIGGLLFKPRVILAGLILIGIFLLLISKHVHGEVTAERQARIIHLLQHDCGACHGLKLTGGLGPPLTPAALKSRTAGELAKIITGGVPHTPMPPWRGFLEAEEIIWLVDLLKTGVPGNQFVMGDKLD